MISRQEYERRFWARIARTENDDECWEWTGCKDRAGYGSVRWENVQMTAHRAVYTILYGNIAKGLVVRHSCDNRPCCNPKHLSLGTTADNVRDKIERGRQKHGEQLRNSKLTESNLKEAVRLYATGDYSQRKLADMFGVRQSTIWEALNKKKWKRVETDAIPFPEGQSDYSRRGSRRSYAKLTEDNVREMRKIHSVGGVSCAELGRKFGVCSQLAAAIIRRAAWTHVE